MQHSHLRQYGDAAFKKEEVTGHSMRGSLYIRVAGTSDESMTTGGKGHLIHFVHNGLLNMVLYYQDQLSFLGEGFDDQTHLPPMWLGIASLLVAFGALLVWASSLKPRAQESTADLAVAN